MLPAANRGAGQNICAPDVCLTPPSPGVPIPYVNIALHAQAVLTSPTVSVCMLPALTIASIIPTTQGDEPGTLHPVTTEVGTFVTGNPIVFIDNLPAINLTCLATGNAMNAPSGAHLVPDAVNVFYTYAAPGARLRDAPPPVERMRGGGVGCLRIAAFTADLPARVHGAIHRLEAAGMRALIVDLRDNPGGELDAAVRLAGDFLARGQVIAVIVDGDGDEVVHRARRDGSYAMPVAVLVNRGTASASEVFAGALQRNGRAVVVGEATYGKGRAESVVRGVDEVRRAIVASCVLPDGSSLEGVGLTPDIAIGGGGEEVEDKAEDVLMHRSG